MITTHTSTNHRNDLYAFLGSDHIEGFRQDFSMMRSGMVSYRCDFLTGP